MAATEPRIENIQFNAFRSKENSAVKEKGANK
jgi:hypothetical protein